MTSAPLKDILIVVRKECDEKESKESDEEKKASVTMSDLDESVSEINIFRALTFLQQIYAKNSTLMTVLNRNSHFSKLLLSLLSTGSPRIQRIVLVMLRDVFSQNPNILTLSEKSDFVNRIFDRIGQSVAVRTRIGDLYAEEKNVVEKKTESKQEEKKEEEKKIVEETSKTNQEEEEEEKVEDEEKNEEKIVEEEENVPSSWHCSVCTFANESSATVCSMCGTPGTNQSSSALPWICSRCTLRNEGTAQNCVLCSAPRPEPSPSTTTTNSSDEPTPVQAPQPTATQTPPPPPPLSTTTTSNATVESNVTADVEQKEEEEEEAEHKEEEEEVEHKEEEEEVEQKEDEESPTTSRRDALMRRFRTLFGDGNENSSIGAQQLLDEMMEYSSTVSETDLEMMIREHLDQQQEDEENAAEVGEAERLYSDSEDSSSDDDHDDDDHYEEDQYVVFYHILNIQ